jgi:GxxExxY protein
VRPSSELSEAIIGCAIRVHSELGAGLLEVTYAACMAHELGLAGIGFEREKMLPVTYRGKLIDCGYRVDLLVANEVIVELKAVDALLPVHEAQVLTYLKMSGCRLGLLINFNVRLLKNGIRRLIL